MFTLELLGCGRSKILSSDHGFEPLGLISFESSAICVSSFASVKLASKMQRYYSTFLLQMGGDPPEMPETGFAVGTSATICHRPMFHRMGCG